MLRVLGSTTTESCPRMGEFPDVEAKGVLPGSRAQQDPEFLDYTRTLMCACRLGTFLQTCGPISEFAWLGPM